MSIADEELTPPADTDARSATVLLGERLGAHGLSLGEDTPATSHRVYLDTFDGRLRAAGLALYHELSPGDSGALHAVERDTGVVRATLTMIVPTEPLLALELPTGDLRELLLPIVDVRALLPLVELVADVAEFPVLDDEQKTVVRLLLQEAALHSGDDAKPLRPRLHLSGVRGYDGERRCVGETAQELGFTVPRHTLLDEAVLASGGSPDGTSSKVGVALLPGQRADVAAAAILRRLWQVIEDNFEGTIADTDAEFLHDLRVAVRRTRAVLRELRSVFPPAELQRFRDEFKWVQAVTGPTRDLDVYVLDFDELRANVPDDIRGDLDPVVTVLRDQRQNARRALVRELQGPRMKRLRRDWDAFIEELVALPTDDRPAAMSAISTVAAGRIRRVYKQMLTMGDAITDESPSEDYHEIRKKGKELRYLLELFATPLYGSDTVKPMIRTLKVVQDVLGRHQDREVQVTRLRELAEPVAMLPGRGPALMAMGVLVERLHEQEVAARAEFAATYAEFSSKDMRRFVKDTFR